MLANRLSSGTRNPTFHEWARKFGGLSECIEPPLEVMLDWALENDTEMRQSMIADMFGETGDLTKQVDGDALMVLQRKTVLAHLTAGESGRSCRILDEMVLKRGEAFTNVWTHLLVADVGICCVRSRHHSESRWRIWVQPSKRGKKWLLDTTR